jgi:hypothetical protein
MECEVPIVPERMLENILASEALGRGGGIRSSAADWARESYHSMPPPIFSNIRLQPVTFLHTNQPGSANSVIFSASHGTFMNAGGGAFGVLPLPKNDETSSSPKKLENKKKRRDQSRVSGSRRKKTKADSTTDLVLSNGDVGNGKLSASKSHKRAACTERTEKISGKKQSCQGIKKSEDGIEQRGGSLNENCLKDSALYGSSNSGSIGILDIYGLKTMPVDLSNKIVDISVNDLLSENFHLPQSVQLGKERKQSGLDNRFINEVGKVLELMPKPSYMEDEKVKMENSSYGPWFSVQREETCEMVLSEEGSTRKCTASSEGSAFPVAKFPLYPMQDFMSRLGLPANECLENLLVQPHRELDTRINENSHANKTCSIPPLQYSLLPSGVCRSVPKRDKETKKGSPWLRGGIARSVNDSSGLGLGLGLRLGLDIKSQANVECKQTVEEWQSRHRSCEEIDKAGMIDLNLQSSEQLLESSIADRQNCSLPSDPTQGFPYYSMNTILTESRMREEKIGECIETGCHLEANCYISEDDNVRSTCCNKENDLEKRPVLHAETVKTQTTEIQDVTNNSWIATETKTNQALKKLKHFTGDEKPEDRGQELRDSVEDVQAPLSLIKHTVQMAEPSQPLPSQFQTLQLDLDKSVPSSDNSIAIPNSPRSEEAARILFDMANSQSHDNGTSLDQENSPDPAVLQQESLKDSTIVKRVVDSQTISNGGFKFTGECKDAKTKTPTNEKRKSLLQGSLLVGKHWPSPSRNSMMPESLPNPFPNGTFVLALRNHNTQETGKDIQRPDITEAEKTSDLHFHSRSSRPSKPITEDTHMRAKGPTLYTSNQIRGDLGPKSVGGDKVHVSTKNSQKPRTDNGNQKFTLSGGQNQQKISIVGHTKSSRQTTAFTSRKR